jgi:hypothetical protein
MFATTSLQASDRNVYVLDGQVVAIARSDSNLEHFCPTSGADRQLRNA